MNSRYIKILQDYRDRAYVSNILCELSCDFFTVLRQIINIPLILTSSVMSIMNSSPLPERDLKIANIVLNALTALLLSLMGNFRVVEKVGSFKQNGTKFIKLCHKIEDILGNEEEQELTYDIIEQIVLDYDSIHENLEFSYPKHIKTKVKNKYINNRTLPNILNCEIDFNKELVAVNVVIDN